MSERIKVRMNMRGVMIDRIREDERQSDDDGVNERRTEKESEDE